MTKIRPKISKKNQYFLTKHEFYTAYHYALQYPDWKSEYKDMLGLKAIGSSDGSAPTNHISRPTESIAIRISELGSKINLIERIVRIADSEIESELLLAVTNENVTFPYLQTVKKINCGKNKFYAARRKFYYLLAKELNR